MSARLFIQPNQIIPQADFKANEGEDGKWQGSQSFWIEKSNFDNLAIRLYFARGKKATDLDPNNDLYFSFLKVKSSSIGTQLGGYTVIEVEYQGFVPPIGDPPDDEKPYMTTSYRGTTKTSEISTHPKYATLTSIESFMMGLLLSDQGFTLANDGQLIGQWVPYIDESLPEGSRESMVFAPLINTENPDNPYSFSTPDALAISLLISKGVKEFEEGTFEYAVRWTDTEPFEQAEIDLLGLITEPIGNPVKPSSGTRNWRLVTINQEQEGTEDPTYTMELVYILSGREGWDETLYGPP